MVRYPILTYHAIGSTASPIYVDANIFDAHLSALAESGYRSLPLATLLELMITGQALPEKHVTITFDDGYASVLDTALPRLQHYGLEACLFIVTDYCDEGGTWLTWQQVEQWLATGMEIGSHTITHPPLAHHQVNQATDEIVQSQRIIEQHIGYSPESFCYPYGDVSQVIRTEVAQVYKGAVGTQLGFVTSQDDVYELHRLDAYYLSPNIIQRFTEPLNAMRFGVQHRLRQIKRIFKKDWA